VSDVAAHNVETTIVLKSAAAPKPSAQPRVAIAVGKTAPDWSLADWSDHRDRKLSDYRGKVVVLEFWGVWCGPCVQSIPLMQSLAIAYGGRPPKLARIRSDPATEPGERERLIRQRLAERAVQQERLQKDERFEPQNAVFLN